MLTGNNNKPLTLDSISSNDFNHFFTTVGQKINNTFADPNLPWRGPSSIYSLIFEPISENMMILLRNLPDKSNNDILGFDSKFLRVASSIICSSLTKIVNISIMNGIMLDDWKLAKVTPVYKGKGDQNELGNYRPISVVSHLSKIFEKCIQNSYCLI